METVESRCYTSLARYSISHLRLAFKWNVSLFKYTGCYSKMFCFFDISRYTIFYLITTSRELQEDCKVVQFSKEFPLGLSYHLRFAPIMPGYVFCFILCPQCN